MNQGMQAYTQGRRSDIGWIAGLIALCALLASATINSPPALASGGGGAGPGLTISSPTPAQGPAGTHVIVAASQWLPGTSITLSIGTTGGACSGSGTVSLTSATGTTVDGNGAALMSFTWPDGLTVGNYPICGSGTGAPGGTVKSSNTFNNLSANHPTIGPFSQAASGGSVSVTGANWFPSGTKVQILEGPSGTDGCTNALVTLTSQSDGTLKGNFTAPTVTQQTTFTVTAVSPEGTCNGNTPSTLRATSTLVVSAAGNSTPTPAAQKPTSTATSATATPGNGGDNGTATPGSGTPTATKTPSSPSPSRPGSVCPPLPDPFCATGIGGIPNCLLCLLGLLLLGLLIFLIVLLARRTNTEKIDSEATVTVDPTTVTPQAGMSFRRRVRVTHQEVRRSSGEVVSETHEDYDIFADAQGNEYRRKV